MYKKRKNISKIALISYLACFIGLSPALAQPKGVQLRGAIDDSPPGIKLKGEININKSHQLISLNLRDSDIKQVLRMIADRAGVNIVFHDSVEGEITLDLVNVTVNKAFEYIMTISGLSYWKDGNTLIVASKSVASGLSINKTQLKPIQVKYLNAANVADFLNSNIFSLNRPDISVNQVVITNPRTNQVLILGNENDYQLAKKAVDLIDVKPLMKTFSVNYVDPGTLGSDICTNVFNSGNAGGSGTSSTSQSSSSSSSSGTSSTSSTSSVGTQIMCGGSADSTGSSGSSGSSDSSSGSSSSSSTASSSSGGGFGGITSTPQSVVTNGYVVIADYDLNQITVSGSKDQIDMAEEIIKRFDKKQPQVYIEVSIIELNESGSKALSSTISGSIGTTSFASYAGSTTIYDANGILHHIDRGNPRLIISEINALITQNKGKVLANPRIIATNNRTSTVAISSDYVRTRKEEIITNQYGAPTISKVYEIADAGINLNLTPKISPNGYVNLNIVPSYTSIKEQIKEDNQLVATLLNKRDLSLDNVRVKDGETLVIGGLIQQSDTNSSSKVPLLGDIPIIGVLFKDTATDRTKSELILMITPKIIKEEDTDTI